MRKQTNYFEYSLPYTSELRELYITPYRFSKELRDYINYMYLHPKHNKYHTIYSAHHTEWISNDMAKVSYLMIRYYQDYPQRYGHNIENILPQIIVSMWKTFLSINKQLNQVTFKQYYPTSMKLLTLGKGKFLDIILNDIEKQNIIYHPDDMVKRREGVGLRERRTKNLSMQEGGKQFEYLCSLE